jgi:hypothetical protein
MKGPKQDSQNRMRSPMHERGDVSLDDESHFFFSRKIMKDIFELP